MARSTSKKRSGCSPGPWSIIIESDRSMALSAACSSRMICAALCIAVYSSCKRWQSMSMNGGFKNLGQAFKVNNPDVALVHLEQALLLERRERAAHGFELH